MGIKADSEQFLELALIDAEEKKKKAIAAGRKTAAEAGPHIRHPDRISRRIQQLSGTDNMYALDVGLQAFKAERLERDLPSDTPDSDPTYWPLFRKV